MEMIRPSLHGRRPGLWQRRLRAARGDHGPSVSASSDRVNADAAGPLSSSWRP